MKINSETNFILRAIYSIAFLGSWILVANTLLLVPNYFFITDYKCVVKYKVADG